MKTIHIEAFDKESIERAKREIEAVKTEWKTKAIVAAKEVCREIAMQIEANLEAMPYSDEMINLETHTIEWQKPSIGVWDLTETKDGCKVYIQGKDVVFVEFGAGYYHNSNGNENPLSEAVQFETDIGSFGKHQGLQPYWFVAHNLISRGTPMYMPIYRAILAVKPEIPTIVRKVFA